MIVSGPKALPAWMRPAHRALTASSFLAPANATIRPTSRAVPYAAPATIAAPAQLPERILERSGPDFFCWPYGWP